MRDCQRVLAAGPWQKGPMDRPHRLVLVEWRTPSEKLDQFSVHWQQDHPDGPLCNGDCFTPDRGELPDGTETQKMFVKALTAFTSKLARRTDNNQIQWCWMYEPVAPPKA